MKMAQTSVKYVSLEELLKNDGYLIYTNVGVSMLPLLREHRDIIEIHRKDSTIPCKRYDVVLFKIDNKYILHRILKVQPLDYVTCGDHNIRKEYGITDEMILGVMTRVIRDGKSIYPTDWKYKVYFHLWCDFYPIRAAILYVSLKVKTVGRRIKKLLFGKIKETNEQL